ncbi:phosphatase PAP2 family protein [Pseudopedobacter beijingensis]|uniref:Phosphatase PAP2 family protein n=1 Tax=Pseudopedobacter beijingensis TaxID=1207056 RepID=A0ABW4ID35_9SPHI
MERLKYLYTTNRPFFTCFMLWFILLTAVAFCIPKQYSFQIINSNNHPFADVFFTASTYTGDGLFVIAAAVICYLIRKRQIAFSLVGTYVFSGLICSVLKNTFQAYRPAMFFENLSTFHIVPWLPLAHHNSFPSGHTTSAFAMATTIALLSGNKKLGVVAICIAFLAGYSRVYLGQHFVEDIWFGSFLGVSTSCLYLLLLPYLSSKNLLKTNFPRPSIKL